MSLRVCMIGCGGFARLGHGPAQRRCAAADPSLQLAACCDPDEARARAYRDAFGYARHYADLDRMLAAERPDAAILAVPPPLTARLAGPLLRRGLPLLLEKPPGLTPTELEALIAAAGPGPARAQVAFNRRYMPVLVRADEILRTRFPADRVLRIDYDLTRFDRWDPDFSTTAIHALDAACWLARSPLAAAELRFQVHRRDDREAASVVVAARCVSGSRLLINIEPVAGLNAERARIHAAGQTLAVDIPASPLSPAAGALELWDRQALAVAWTGDAGGVDERFGLHAETAAFFDSVRSGAGFSPGLADCRQVVALMEAIRLRRSTLEFA